MTHRRAADRKAGTKELLGAGVLFALAALHLQTSDNPSPWIALGLVAGAVAVAFPGALGKISRAWYRARSKGD